MRLLNVESLCRDTQAQGHWRSQCCGIGVSPDLHPPVVLPGICLECQRKQEPSCGKPAPRSRVYTDSWCQPSTVKSIFHGLACFLRESMYTHGLASPSSGAIGKRGRTGSNSLQGMTVNIERAVPCSLLDSCIKGQTFI